MIEFWVSYCPADASGESGDWNEGASQAQVITLARSKRYAQGISWEAVCGQYEMVNLTRVSELPAWRWNPLYQHWKNQAYPAGWTSPAADSLMRIEQASRDIL